MKKCLGFFMLCFLIPTFLFSQVDSINSKTPLSVFARITKDLKEYSLDTTAAPDDKITRVITELRSLKGGFNINEAIEYKLEEEKQKKEMPEADLEKLSNFFKNGDGKKWLDNAVIWIYRKHFTYRELKKIVKFYKTTAGQKMATEFPVVMMKSLAAGEGIKSMNMQAQNNKK